MRRSATTTVSEEPSTKIHVHPAAVVAARAKVPASCRIGPFCVIGDDVELGEDCELISHVSVQGRVVELADDPDLAGIDRLSTHYNGVPYPVRDRRRVSAWIEVESWYGWAAARPWTGSE